MRRSLIPILTALLLAALVLVAAGCGGKKSSSAATEAVTTETTAAETTTTAEDTTEETTTEEDVDVSDVASTADCRELVNLSAKLAESFSGTGENVQETADFLREFADRTPEEIREDFQLIADAYAKIVKALEGIDLSSGTAPSADVLQRLQEVTESLDQDALEKATANIDAWAKENCT